MKVFILMACLGISTNISGLEPFAATPEETQMCAKAVYARKVAKDPNWGHMHHYCNGLRFYNRGVRTRSQPKDFKFNIGKSVNQFDYVLSHTDPDFDMRPEVLVMRGRSLELLGRDLESTQMYNEALKLNPRFSMAYAALGNFHAKSGNKDEALEIYQEGLRRSPNNRYLRSRYKALGGVPLESSNESTIDQSAKH